MRWLFIIILLLAYGCSQAHDSASGEKPQAKDRLDVIDMKISSDAFGDGEAIPKKYTCQGDDVSPMLIFSDVPKEAKSLALIVDDPDAPGGNWVHWLVKDILPSAPGIQEGSSVGVQVENDFGKSEYGGPCPPSGTHRYFFKLYALDAETIPAANSDDFYSQVEEHKITESKLMGTYKKE